MGNLAATSSSSLTSSTTYIPPSLHIQLWLSALSHTSAHQLVVNRCAFTLVCGMAIMSPFRSGCGRLDRNPSSKCQVCFRIAFLRCYQILYISVAGVDGAQSPLYTPPPPFSSVEIVFTSKSGFTSCSWQKPVFSTLCLLFWCSLPRPV